jgi:Lon protease-like protein
MYELPLFPLNTVLFPGMPLHLHIFEERYKLMIGRCIEEEEPFGVVLIQKGLEALGPVAMPHAIGCTARIVQVEKLAGGRMNIAAVGQDRFQTVSLDRRQPYLQAQVEPFPLLEPAAEAAAESARRLQPWVVRYMEVLSEVDGVDLDSAELPDDPASFAYLAATLLQVPVGQKQGLLAMAGLGDMLEVLRGLYRREMPVIRAMLAKQVVDQGVFSLN